VKRGNENKVTLVETGLLKTTENPAGRKLLGDDDIEGVQNRTIGLPFLLTI
jgi:hypothetical protein